jgi:hypothetical protein
MTIRHLTHSAVIAAAIVSGAAANGQMACAPTPERYRRLEFGHVRFAIEETCSFTFTQDEQFFVAGIAQTLLNNCKLPKDSTARAAVERFTTAVDLALDFRLPDGTIRDAVNAQSDSKQAFNAGVTMMQNIPCRGPQAALLSRGIVIYVSRTSGKSRFVEGCVEFYAGRYDEKQCRCIAVNLRGVLPDVDQRYFNRNMIKESIHRSPLIAWPIIWSCGAANY